MTDMLLGEQCLPWLLMQAAMCVPFYPPALPIPLIAAPALPIPLLAAPALPIPPLAPPSLPAGSVLAVANLLAGRLNYWTLSRGWGDIGCFLGGGIGCSLSMALLAVFAWRGELGRDELLQGAGAAQQAQQEPPLAAAAAA